MIPGSVAQGIHSAALRLALQQGQRLLDFQNQNRESILRRSSDLLKLSVATLGGVIGIGGILSTSRARIVLIDLLGFGVGVTLIMIAAVTLALSLAGGRSVGAFAYGPDLLRIAGRFEERDVDEVALLVSLVQVQPEWVQENDLLMIRMQRMNAAAVISLALGSLIFSLTLLYILGGAILA